MASSSTAVPNSAVSGGVMGACARPIYLRRTDVFGHSPQRTRNNNMYSDSTRSKLRAPLHKTPSAHYPLVKYALAPCVASSVLACSAVVPSARLGIRTREDNTFSNVCPAALRCIQICTEGQRGQAQQRNCSGHLAVPGRSSTRSRAPV